jgi:hypothetical protein
MRQYTWVHGVVAALALIWILDGLVTTYVGVAGAALLMSTGLSGVGAYVAICGVVYLSCGIGIVLGQDWAFAYVRTICVLRIFLSVFVVWFLLHVNPIASIYPVLAAAFSGFQIWILSKA